VAETWERDVLKTLQAPVTTGNLKLLRSWQRWEGGHTNNSATYNWLNTTRGKQFPGINSVGVRAFPDYRTGVAYTADTIIGGYPGMVQALRSGKPYSSSFRESLLSDLSKWVSGSRDARRDYGLKVLGMNTGPAVARATTRQLRQPKNRNELSLASLAGALDDGDDFWDLVAANPIEFPELAQPVSKPHPMTPVGSRGGRGFQVPTEWSGTHVTDNLGWGTKTAHDFILPAGTPLKAPESGKVIEHGSAQGGGSLWFKGDSGRVYWFGHVDNRVPKGRRLKKGQRYANVSADHETPHLHADVQ
jgi:murein DD-endopeptidase MepM/ murein hydrolase activator NlpD